MKGQFLATRVKPVVDKSCVTSLTEITEVAPTCLENC